MKNRYLLSILPLITLILPSVVFSMSIGDINVSSQLGEPFRASVNISNAPAEIVSDCFKVNQMVDGSDGMASSLNANLSLKKINNDDYNLIISTFRTINEPILELVLSSECGNNSTRQFTVLLNPSISEPDIVAPILDNQILAISKKPSIVKHKKFVHKQYLKRRHSTTKSQMAQTNHLLQRTNSSPLPSPVANSARLVISGSSSKLKNDTNTLPLMLDNNLHQITPSISDQTKPLNNNIESDDITALKLHIAQLEKRNLELEAAIGSGSNIMPPNPAVAVASKKVEAKTEAVATNKLIKPKAEHKKPWLVYFLIAALIIIALLFLSLMLKSKRRLKLATNLSFNEASFGNELDDNNPKKSPPPAFEHSSFGNTSQYSLRTQIEIEQNSKDDVLREVEVFMALGRNNLAIKLLQANVREFPKDSPNNWLLLLDLLKQENLPLEYAETTEKCQKIFNIYITPFGESDISDNSTLEDHPHVEEKLEQVWGTSNMVPYLEELIYNSRNEARKGFFKNVYLEFLLLHKIALTRDRFDDSNVQPATSSSTIFDDKVLKTKFDTVNNQTGEIKPNLFVDTYSDANDIDAEFTKREIASSNKKDADTSDLNMPIDFATLTDTSHLNGEMKALDIPSQHDLTESRINNESESTLEMELAKFAERQVEHEKKPTQINSFYLEEFDETINLELPTDKDLTQTKPKKKTSKKNP